MEKYVQSLRRLFQAFGGGFEAARDPQSDGELVNITKSIFDRSTHPKYAESHGSELNDEAAGYAVTKATAENAALRFENPEESPTGTRLLHLQLWLRWNISLWRDRICPADTDLAR